MPKSTSTVFVIDDDPAIGQSISWLLSSVQLTTEVFLDPLSFLEVYDPSRKGCLVIDVRMPGMSGLELQQELIKRHNPLPIIMISGHGDVPMAVRAMQAGAKDFILKPFNDQLFLEKVQLAVNEDLQKSSPVNAAILNSRYQTLTQREREVMALVVKGYLNKQMAAELNISMSTIELHRAKVMQKMQAKSLAELIKYAIDIAVC